VAAAGDSPSGDALSAALHTTLREQAELHRQLQEHIRHTRTLEQGLLESGRKLSALQAAVARGPS
jgi:hypothetical protein